MQFEKVIVYKLSKKRTNQELIHLCTTPGPEHHMGSDKNTRKFHIRASQEVSPFQAGDHKAAMNRQESMSNTKHK